jgi:hypothetical protein
MHFRQISSRFNMPMTGGCVIELAFNISLIRCQLQHVFRLRKGKATSNAHQMNKSKNEFCIDLILVRRMFQASRGFSQSNWTPFKKN